MMQIPQSHLACVSYRFLFVSVYCPPMALPTSWPFGRYGTMISIWYLLAAPCYMLPVCVSCPFSWVLELKMPVLSLVCVETPLDFHGIITQYIFYLISVFISDSWIFAFISFKICFLLSISMYLVEEKPHQCQTTIFSGIVFFLSLGFITIIRYNNSTSLIKLSILTG